MLDVDALTALSDLRRAPRAHLLLLLRRRRLGEALARHARELGYTHLGITDTADLGGIAKFAVEAMSPLRIRVRERRAT